MKSRMDGVIYVFSRLPLQRHFRYSPSPSIVGILPFASSGPMVIARQRRLCSRILPQVNLAPGNWANQRAMLAGKGRFSWGPSCQCQPRPGTELQNHPVRGGFQSVPRSQWGRAERRAVRLIHGAVG